MTSRARLGAVGAAVGLALAVPLAGWAQDATGDRQAAPGSDEAAGQGSGRGQGLSRRQGAIRPRRRPASDDLLKTLPQVPNAFPQKTSSAEFPGKTRAKPVIWAEWDKFLAAQQNALSKAQTLDAAVKTGDKARSRPPSPIWARSGCNGCHDTFREPQKHVEPKFRHCDEERTPVETDMTPVRLLLSLALFAAAHAAAGSGRSRPG